MKLKTATLFRLNQMKLTFIIYYGIILALFVLAMIIQFFEIDATVNMTIPFASSITLFIGSLTSFKPEFNMFMQNGVSRKACFISMLCSSTIISGIMAIIDTALTSAAIAVTDSENWSLMRIIFYMQERTVGTMQGIAEEFLFSFLIYFTAFATGYFISILYYRMNKILKTVVSIAVPVLFIFVIPFFVYLAPDFSHKLLNLFMEFFIGLKIGGAPYFAYLVFLSSAVIFFLFAGILSRRAEIKDK